MKTVILAGGLGTRLQPYTIFVPKPMLPLGEKPLLEHIIEWNKKNGIKKIVLCVSYLRKTIIDYFEDGSSLGVNIEYAVSKKPLSTAGQLKTAQAFIDGDFVCMNGDSIFNFSLRSMIKQHRKRKSFITMNLHTYKTNIPYGVIKTDSRTNKKITGWDEKPAIKVHINTGCYIMNSEVLSYIPKNRPYGMDAMVNKIIAQKKKVDSFITTKEFIDVGDKMTYERAYQTFYKKLGEI